MEYLGSPEFKPVPIVRTDGRAVVLDLGIGSDALGEPLKNLPVDRFTDLVDQVMMRAGTAFAFGRWGEPRELYTSDLFSNDSVQQTEPRIIHMGVDLFCKAGTAV